MKKKNHFYITSIVFTSLAISFASCSNKTSETTQSTKIDPTAKSWVIGDFVRPEGVNPIIKSTDVEFMDPMSETMLKWEESDTFNPAATVKDGEIIVLYRAEDNSAQGIGRRTSRIGYASSKDGVTMNRKTEPVLYPDNDNSKDIEWPGGIEDPRVVQLEDGTYAMHYTAWNRQIPRLAVATSKDLIKWEKHGLAFGKAYDGRFKDLECKAASVVTKLKDGKLVTEKINGKYFMYWGETAVCAATSDDMINWEPVLDENGNLRRLAQPRRGFFDSNLSECGPPAIMTKDGIVLLYNGKNGKHEDYEGDKNYPEGSYCAGQILFDSKDPFKVLDRTDKPFFYPSADFEKSGQYVDGTVFIEGLAYYKNKLYLYYGCADSLVGVAVCENVENL